MLPRPAAQCPATSSLIPFGYGSGEAQSREPWARRAGGTLSGGRPHSIADLPCQPTDAVRGGAAPFWNGLFAAAPAQTSRQSFCRARHTTLGALQAQAGCRLIHSRGYELGRKLVEQPSTQQSRRTVHSGRQPAGHGIREAHTAYTAPQPFRSRFLQRGAVGRREHQPRVVLYEGGQRLVRLGTLSSHGRGGNRRARRGFRRGRRITPVVVYVHASSKKVGPPVLFPGDAREVRTRHVLRAPLAQRAADSPQMTHPRQLTERGAARLLPVERLSLGEGLHVDGGALGKSFDERREIRLPQRQMREIVCGELAIATVLG